MSWKIGRHFQIQTREYRLSRAGRWRTAGREREKERREKRREAGRDLRDRLVRITMQLLRNPRYPPSFLSLPISPPSLSLSLFFVPQEATGARPSPIPLAANDGENWDYLNFWVLDFCGTSIAFSVLCFVFYYDFVERDRWHCRVLTEFCSVCFGVSVVFCLLFMILSIEIIRRF